MLFLLFFVHLRFVLTFDGFVVVGVEFCESEVNDNALLELSVVEEVSGFDVSVENALLL